MDLAVVLTTFLLIIPAELPDKTFISCVVLASRHPPGLVWLGAWCALVVQTAIAVVAGRLLTLLPHTLVEAIISALFIGGAAYLLLVPLKAEEQRGAKIAREEEDDLASRPLRRATGAVPVVAADAAAPEAPPAGAARTRPSPLRVVATTFGIIALAEFGDVTQVLLANLTARYQDALSVFVGGVLGFAVIAAVGVAAGKTITRWAPMSLVRRISGLALLALGIYTIVNLAIS